MNHFLSVDALMLLAFFFFSFAYDNGIAPCGMIKVLLNSIELNLVWSAMGFEGGCESEMGFSRFFLNL